MDKTAKYMRFSENELIENIFPVEKFLSVQLHAVPYGYEKIGTRVYVNSKKAKIVQGIYDNFIDGKSFKEIADSLTIQRIPTPSMDKAGKRVAIKWSPTTIRFILTNPFYVGARPYPGTSRFIQNTHEPMVEKKIFNDVKRIIDHRIRRRQQEREHLLSGLIFCGECGAALSSVCKKGQKRYFVCSAWKKNSGICSAHSVNEGIVIRAVLTQLYVIVKSINTDELTITSKQKECAKMTEKLQNRIEESENRLVDLYKEKSNAFIGKAEYISIAEIFKSEIAFCKSQVKKISEICDEKYYYLEMQTVLDNLLNFEKIDKLYINKLIKKIKVYNDGHIKIEFNFTEPE